MTEQTRIEKEFEKVLTPFQDFVKDQTTSSAILIICTITALIIANSSLSPGYEALIKTDFGFVIDDWSVTMDVKHWINDGLMSVFFFLLGMEIKREILAGEIKDVKRLLPIVAAATGGMLVPALIYYAFNVGTEFDRGWGIPMATDTAFAIGILALLGKRIPSTAFTFLAALAIIDDLGAILVIALFYTDTISLHHLVICVFALGLLIIFNVIGIRKPWVYLLGGLIVWSAMLNSGVHATVAGILVAMTVPARSKREPGWFLNRMSMLMKRFEQIENQKGVDAPMLGESEQHAVVEYVHDAAEKASTPLRRWESTLEHPVALFIIPIFALANAGIPFDMHVLSNLWHETLAVGIVLGLVVGKGIGIPLFTYLAIRLNLGNLPADINMKHVAGLGLLGGMGFTMSIFISGLGFENVPQSLLTAKASILIASLLAGISGYLWLRISSNIK